VTAVNGNGSSWWRQQITVGNIVQIAVIAFGLAGFYFTTSATLTSHAKAIDVQAKAMTEVIADIRRLDRGRRSSATRPALRWCNAPSAPPTG
jgi:hypothetical protein